MKKIILTFHDNQISSVIPMLHGSVVGKFNIFEDVDYRCIKANAGEDKIALENFIDVYLNQLFYEEDYESVLILDIDCIHLCPQAIEETFSYIEQGYLVGNAQRSQHLDNGGHIFCGSSCVGISKTVYEQIEKPSAERTDRSDICEEYTWLCEEHDVPIKFYTPNGFEKIAYNESSPWTLDGKMQEYGIGTTFNNGNSPYFYHLFQTSLSVYNPLFIRKCQSLLSL